jgi:hypothetical protein
MRVATAFEIVDVPKKLGVAFVWNAMVEIGPWFEDTFRFAVYAQGVSSE